MLPIFFRFRNHEQFAEVARELFLRAGSGKTESGCFILGDAVGSKRFVRDVIYFDDIDPKAYSHGGIRFDTTRLSAVYDICEQKALSIIGDIHVHPCEAFLSHIDAAYPVIALEGHVSVILPYDGRYASAHQIAVNIYDGDGRWHHLPSDKIEVFLGLDQTETRKESFNRIELALLERGIKSTERRKVLEATQVSIVADRSSCQTPQGQAAILTAVALSSRFARGGVFVAIEEDAKLAALPDKLLSKELKRLGAYFSTRPSANAILIGDAEPPADCFAVRVFGKDGSYGCTDAGRGALLSDDYVPGAIAASAMSVGEIFRFRVLQKNEVKPRTRSLNLWRPSELTTLPYTLNKIVDDVWLLGFGHLGNAYAWTIAFTPGFRPHVFVQDPQTIDFANTSTQVFAVPADINRPKTDLARTELSRFGLTVETDEKAIHDRYIPSQHPKIVLGGLDQVAPRRALSNAAVKLIVDAGLGDSTDTFSQFSLHTLTDAAKALDVFHERQQKRNPESRIKTGAFVELPIDTEQARCGVLSVAEADVAVPFVGLTVAPMALTIMLRASLGLDYPASHSGDALNDSTIDLYGQRC